MSAVDASPAQPPASERLVRLLCLAGLLCGLVALAIGAGWTGPDVPAAPIRLLAISATSLLWAVGWLLMAYGVGWPLKRILVPRSGSAAALQLALGASAALAVLNALASAGWLGGAVAWGLLLGGGVAGAVCLGRKGLACRLRRTGGSIACLAAPAAAVLWLAAASAPGWLWSTEFGGYDALSYHLALPKEWLIEGRLRPGFHCVYGFLPSGVEGAFLHLMRLRGDDAQAAHAAAIACQMLHALLAVTAAWCVGEAAAAWWRNRRDATRRRIAGGIACVLVLATPWTVVVGSLAYNEMPLLLALGAGLCLLAEAKRHAPARLGAALGLLGGAACLAKLTAAGMVALPLGAVALAVVPWRRWPALGGGALLVGALLAAPWLLRNAAVSGNPLFPFATELLGTGEWTVEQARVFDSGHRSDLGALARAERLWRQWIAFGVGANPQPGEPWRPLYALLTPGGIAALAFLWLRPTGRRAALPLTLVLLVQVGFWLLATHLQSRFLVPTIAPLAIACGLALGLAVRGRRSLVAVAAAVGIASFVPLLVYAEERQGAPAAAIGRPEFFNGDLEAAAVRSADPAARALMERSATVAFHLNHALPEDSRVLLVGEARTFWLRGAPAAYGWNTVWDRGPLEAAIAAAPEDPAAWASDLRAQGWTHVLVDPSMLERWRVSGWLAPELSLERLARLPGRTVHRYPGGAVLVEIGEGGGEESGIRIQESGFGIQDSGARSES